MITEMACLDPPEYEYRWLINRFRLSDDPRAVMTWRELQDLLQLANSRRNYSLARSVREALEGANS